ncbi:MAG: YncE family protein [Terracidiphilus sp.]
MRTHSSLLLFVAAFFVVALLIQGCGGGSSTTTTTGPTTPTVQVTPGASSVAEGQLLSVAVAVSGSGSTPSGTIAVVNGNYASFQTVLSGGKASIQVPAALLATGSVTLSAYYTPDLASSTTYNSASGTAAVTVTAGPAAPVVSTSSVTYPTAGAPFQAVVDSAGTVFVGIPSGIQVFTPANGALTPTCTNSLSSTLLSEGASVANLSLLPNGTDLAAGIGSAGAAFFNINALTSCTASSFVVSQGSMASDQGTLDVEVTPDGKYAFVSNEYGVVSGASSEGNIGVVQLVYDANGNVTTGSTLLGQISTGGNAIAGMTLSPDGTRLYVTTEIATSASNAVGTNPVLVESDCVQAAGSSPQSNGTLTVINVAKAESAPGPSAILATVNAGCSPVRMAESKDESTLWVTARGVNRVLAFSTGMLEFNPGNALVGYASTGGAAPVGVRLFDNDQLLAVANSNRFGTGTAPNATILSAAVPASASVLQTVQTGLFPREIWVGPDDATLYLTNYDSDTLQVISTTVN